VKDEADAITITIQNGTGWLIAAAGAVFLVGWGALPVVVALYLIIESRSGR
jgi:hypothetical protein